MCTLWITFLQYKSNFPFTALKTWQWLCKGCLNKSARFNFVINASFIQKVLIFLFQHKVNILRLIVDDKCPLRLCWIMGDNNAPTLILALWLGHPIPVVYSVLFSTGLLAAVTEDFFMDFVGENGVLQTDCVHLTSLIVYHSWLSSNFIQFYVNPYVKHRQ